MFGKNTNWIFLILLGVVLVMVIYYLMKAVNTVQTSSKVLTEMKRCADNDLQCLERVLKDNGMADIWESSVKHCSTNPKGCLALNT